VGGPVHHVQWRGVGKQSKLVVLKNADFVLVFSGVQEGRELSKIFLSKMPPMSGSMVRACVCRVWVWVRVCVFSIFGFFFSCSRRGSPGLVDAVPQPVKLKEWKIFDLLLQMELATFRERRILYNHFNVCDHFGNDSSSLGLHGSAAVDDGIPSKLTQPVSRNGGNSPFCGIDLSTCRLSRELYMQFTARGEPTDGGTSSSGCHEAMPFLDFMCRDPNAADLLISMALAAAKCSDQTRRKLLLPSIPPEFCTPDGEPDLDALARTLDKLPPIAEVVALRDTPESIAEIDNRLPASLQWILESFDGHLEQLKEEVVHPDWHIFLVKPSVAAVSRGLDDRERAAGGSLFAFHGSSFYNWHSILRSRLKIASGTPLQANGSAHGKGIYLGEVLHVSLPFARRQSAWDNSLFGTSCFALCEIAPGATVLTKRPMFVVKDEWSVELMCLIVISNIDSCQQAPVKNTTANHLASLVKATVQYRNLFGN
jgi:Poly(ADP-ribose) polymerase catalytic domain/ARTD15 N-terminal domain